MTLKDCYGLSLHTIKENKSRSILTVIISTFLSLLIMALMVIIISFLKNGNNILNKVYFENSIISINYHNEKVNGYVGQKLFQKNEYQTYKKILDDNNDIVSYVTYTTNGQAYNNPTFTDPYYPVTTGIEILEGRNISPTDNEVKEMVISQNYYNASLSSGNPYNLNSIHVETVYFSKAVGRRWEVVEFQIKYKVVGIFTYTEDKYLVNGRSSTAIGESNMICDISNYLTIDSNDLYVSSATIYYKNSVEGVNASNMFNRIKALKARIANEMPPSIMVISTPMGAEYDTTDPTNCPVVSAYDSLNQMRMIFLIGGGVISLVLLLMSVGSLANSVLISINKSKKFIGLLKALGLKGKELKRVLILESITLIATGVLIAYGLLFALYSPLMMVTDALTSSIYGTSMVLVNYSTILYIPIYIFIGAVVLFVFLTMVFARGSLRKVSKMDPIAVISEVS